MATQTLPHVVSSPQSVEISQQELVELIEARNTLDALKKYVERLESGLQARLEAGAAVEQGVHIAHLRVVVSRRNVGWREQVEMLADDLYGGVGHGRRYCEGVLAATLPTRTLSLIVK